MKTRAELTRDLEKYQVQMKLFKGRTSLTQQEAYDHQSAKNNFMITMLALLQLRVKDLEEQMAGLMRRSDEPQPRDPRDQAERVLPGVQPDHRGRGAGPGGEEAVP